MLVEMGDLPRPDPKLLMSSLFMGGASKQNGSKQSNSVAGTTGAGVGGADSEQADENRKRKIDQLQQGEDAAAADAAKIQRGRPSFIWYFSTVEEVHQSIMIWRCISGRELYLQS
jgi:hypothetical protein